jgi:hypothetical protein
MRCHSGKCAEDWPTGEHSEVLQDGRKVTIYNRAVWELRCHHLAQEKKLETTHSEKI